MGAYDVGRRGEPFVTVGNYAATDSSVSVQAAPSARRAVVVQRVTMEVYTAAAQDVTFGDGTTTLLFDGNTLGSHGWDFGEGGLRFADATAVTFSSTAGPAFSYAVVGYLEGPKTASM